MEYFEYLRIPQYILQLVRGASGGITLGELYIMFGVAGGAYLICLVVGGLALFTMAERAKVKHSWLGFIPFANTYYAGKITGEIPFFGKKMKRAGLYAMIAEIVYCMCEIMSIITSVLIASPEYYETNYLEGGGSTLTLNLERVPQGIRWMADASTWFSIISIVANLVMIVFLCAVYSGLYRKYSPRNGFALTVFSVLLPIRAFLLFAVRNNQPVDYDEYMKKRIEQAMQSAGMTVEEMKKPDDPFSDFAEKPASAPSPFEEFDDIMPDSDNHGSGGSEGSDSGNSDGE